ncbi:MAG: hypothetical protein JNK48_34280 [Bryobacterales bacterium]|nr:hypothetical protein [Bryobacterales bacterium]
MTLLCARETVPAGGVAQIEFHLAEPRRVSGLHMTVEFDEAQVSAILSYAVMSAAGDAHSFAEIRGGRMDVRIRASSGTIGLLPEQPVLVAAVRLQEDVASGTVLAVKVKTDSEEVKASPVTVGGTMHVASLTRVGNRVEVRGAGLTPSVRAQWEFVRVHEVEYVSPELLRLAIDGEEELRGKRLHLRDGDGPGAEVYFANPPVRVGDGEFVTLPQFRVVSGHEQFTSPLQQGGFVLRNPHAKTVEARVQLLDLVWNWREEMRVRLEPGASAYVDRGSAASSHMILLSEAPLEAVKFSRSRTFASPVISRVTQELYDTDRRYLLPLPRAKLEWDWAAGQALPASRTFTMRYPMGTVPPVPEMTARLENAASWVSFGQPKSVEPRTVAIEVSVDPSRLSPGVHRARILVDPRDESQRWFTEQGWVDVVLRVTASPRLTTSTVAFTASGGSARVALPGNANLSSNVFSYSTPWLQVDPANGSLVALPTSLNRGAYVSQWLVRGAGFEHLTSAVLLQNGGGPLGGANPVEIRVEEGGGFAAHVRVVPIPLPQLPAVRAVTGNGGEWLRASAVSGGVMLFVNSASLRAGLYGGMVSLEFAGAPLQQIPVALAVGTLYPLGSMPSRIALRGCESASIRFNGGPASMTVVEEEPRGWLAATVREDGLGVTFRARECGMAAGVYRAEAQFRAGADTARTEIVLTVEEALPSTGLPRIAGLLASGDDLLIYGGGFRRGATDVARVWVNGRTAEVLDATGYVLRVTPPPGRVRELRIELGAWSDHWRWE